MRVFSAFASAAALILGAVSGAGAATPLPPIGGGFGFSVCHDNGVCQIPASEYYSADGSNFGDHAFEIPGASGSVRGVGAPAPLMFATATSHSPGVQVEAETDLTYSFRFTAPSLAAAAALDAYKQSLIDAGAMCNDRRCRSNTVPVALIEGFYGLQSTAGLDARASVVGGSDSQVFMPTCSGVGAWQVNCAVGAWSIRAPLIKVSDLDYNGTLTLIADALIPAGFSCGDGCLATATALIDPVISLPRAFAGAEDFTLTLSPGLANGTAAPGGPVPEPAGWALLIAGFGLAGAQLRGRKGRGAMTPARQVS